MRLWTSPKKYRFRAKEFLSRPVDLSTWTGVPQRRTRLETRMTQHAPSRSGRPSSGVLSAIVAGVVALGSLIAVPTFFANAASPTALSAGQTKTLGCPGSSLAMTRTSATAVSLTCTATQVKRIGSARRYAATNSVRATTPLPSGTTTGTLLVAVVETSGSKVTMPPSWAKAFERSNGGGRLTAFWKFAGSAEKSPLASLSKATQVSMLTTGFSGVKSSKPVCAAAAAAGRYVPAVKTPSNGLAFLAIGSAGTKGVAGAPSGSALGLTINNGAGSQVALATSSAVLSSGSSRAWKLNASAPAVAASFAISPISSAALASGATAVQPGSTWSGTCSGKSLDTSRVNATTVKLTCTAQPVPIRNVGGATTFTSPGSDSPRTALPKGTAAGDLL